MAGLTPDTFCDRCGARLGEGPAGGRLRPTCPDCGRVVYRQLKVGAGVLIVDGAALLLLKRGPGGAFPGAWNLPAGYCEADETPAAAAAREAGEETGLQVVTGRLVDAYYFHDDPRGSGVLLVFEAAAAEGELRLDPAEVADAGYFLPDDLPMPLAGGGHDLAIRAWQARALDRWQPGARLRYCPHCTRPLEERPVFDRLRLACPACGFVYFQGPKVGVSVLVEQLGAVLLVRRAVEPGRGKWCLPAGFCEWDEPPEQAAARECREEAGLEVQIVGLVDVQHYTDDFRGPGITLVYAARAVAGSPDAGDDADAARFFDRAALPPEGEIAFASHRLVLARWRAGELPELEPR